MRRQIAPAALVVLLAVAGCAGPFGSGPTATGAGTPTNRVTPATSGQGSTPVETAATATRESTSTPDQSTPTATPYPDPPGGVDVKGTRLPVNATRIFRRVERLLGVDATAPTVQVWEHPTPATRERSTFVKRLGLAVPREDRRSLDPSQPVLGMAGAHVVTLAVPTGTVHSVPPGAVEWTLVHEFVHVVQQQRGVIDRLRGRVPSHVRAALVEGSAVYVSQVYAKRYGLRTASGRTPLADRRARYENAAVYARHWNGRYYYGALFVRRRVRSPAGIWAVFRDPPSTMEQILDPSAVGGNSTAPLSVRTDAPGRNATVRGRLGALMVRTVLEVQLPRPRARAAADGWNNDSVVRLASADGNAYVWVLRWDDAAEADEFERALRTYARRQENRTWRFRVVRVAPDTVALVVGSGPVVGSVDFDATGATVVVTVRSNASVGKESMAWTPTAET